MLVQASGWHHRKHKLHSMKEDGHIDFAHRLHAKFANRGMILATNAQLVCSKTYTQHMDLDARYSLNPFPIFTY